MPSGTLEMENLRKLIEEDPTFSEDETSDSPAGEPEQLASLSLYLALQMGGESVPRSWKHAVHVPHWLNAMKAEKGELEGKGAWELVWYQDHEAKSYCLEYGGTEKKGRERRGG